MTPKEKAEELVKKYEIQFLSFGDYLPTIKAKKCALIAVDEILKELTYTENYVEDNMGRISIYIKYWQEVKQEIEKL